MISRCQAPTNAPAPQDLALVRGGIVPRERDRRRKPSKSGPRSRSSKQKVPIEKRKHPPAVPNQRSTLASSTTTSTTKRRRWGGRGRTRATPGRALPAQRCARSLYGRVCTNAKAGRRTREIDFKQIIGYSVQPGTRPVTRRRVYACTWGQGGVAGVGGGGGLEEEVSARTGGVWRRGWGGWRKKKK